MAGDDVVDRPHGRRRARALALSALVACAVALVGCSAGGAASDAGGVQPEVAVEGAGGDAAADADRSVFIEGSMSIVAADVEAASAAAAGIVREAGGRIDGREEWNDRDGDTALATTTMILRIPAESLDDALEELRELGTVESLRTTTTDVTTDVQDVDARVAALQSTLARLESFQAEAASVEDLLTIEQEISERQTELEGNLAQQAELAEQVAFSTITLSIQSEPSTPSSPDSFLDGLVVGWTSFVTFLAGFAIVLGMLLPWLLGLGLLAAAIMLLVRWLGRRSLRQKPPAAPPTAPPADEALPWVRGETAPQTTGANHPPTG